jgi:EAL domain-containing protein (putative c-di-GMP-specific phosphodiesterase class I)
LFDLEAVAAVVESGGPRTVLQPICRLDTTEVTGFEALARFDSGPTRRPDVWFAQATRLGLGVELETAAVRRALAHLPSVPRGQTMAINVSARTLCSAALATALRDVPGERIVLELTEHEVIDDYAHVNIAAEPYRRRGFRLAVDDAGAGCAGFTHIVKLQPDVIKLDRTITSGIDLHLTRQSLARSVRALADAIGAIVVAEGIEAAAELDTLRRVGITHGQGFLLGRPGD